MNIGIMGGTFDPIHYGHLIAAEQAREQCRLDEVWFMPANVPPHKENAPAAVGEQRLEMVRRAVAGHPYFRPCDFELRQGGTSYTVQTVKQLKPLYPCHHFHYIIGADMVQYLPHWHRIEELAGLIGFIGLERPGTEIDWNALPQVISQKVKMVRMPLIDISSTDIRERLKHGQSVRYLIPETVREYVKENKLYEPEP